MYSRVRCSCRKPGRIYRLKKNTRINRPNTANENWLTKKNGIS